MASDALELELQTIVSCQVGAGNRTWIPFKINSAFNVEPSLQPFKWYYNAFTMLSGHDIASSGNPDILLISVSCCDACMGGLIDVPPCGS